MADEVRYDVGGYETVTEALVSLLNQYPGLDGDEIQFSTLSSDGGKAMFPMSGAIINTESTDILGEVRQECLYPFYVIYRGNGLTEARRSMVKDWLDNLGRWLERETVFIDGTEYQLDSYPALSGTRKFTAISRQTPAYPGEASENDRIEDWMIHISAQYLNEFYKR